MLATPSASARISSTIVRSGSRRWSDVAMAHVDTRFRTTLACCRSALQHRVELGCADAGLDRRVTRADREELGRIVGMSLAELTHWIVTVK